MPAFIHAVKSRLLAAVGGRERLPIVLVLGSVLGLDTADKGAISAIARPLKDAFDIGNTEFGLLLAVVSFVGAAAVVPMGILADRTRRKTILLTAIAFWAVAMIVSGFATSYLFLLISRMFLGVVTAAAWPSIASMTGDFVPASERAKFFGLIVAGELVGAGVGLFISGQVSAALNWRWSFYAMAVPSVILFWAVWRYLPEPARGSQSRSAVEAGRGRGDASGKGAEPSMRQEVRAFHIEPRQDMIIREDPTRRSWLWALGYLVRIRTYDLLVAASALVYFFFAGIRAYGVIYFTEHYGLSRGTVTALMIVFGFGAIVGVVLGGRLSAWLVSKEYLTARIVVPAVALVLAVPLFGLGIWFENVWIGMTAITAGAVSLASAVPPIDAARLDIVHPAIWGRAEAGRMMMRTAFEGAAPLLFGWVSGQLGGGGEGLMWTFLIMLAPMIAAASLAWPARRSYLRDVSTATASIEATLAKEADR